MAEPITKDEVRHLIQEWDRLHDEHAAMSAYLPIIAEKDFEIHSGESLWKGRAGLEAHEDMKQQFFDENHLYNSIELVSATGGQAEAKSVMTWEARTREARAPRSTTIKAVIHHTWEFMRSAKTGQPVILRHGMDKLAYLPGFEPAKPSAPNSHKT